MENQLVHNWFGSIISFPSVVTEPESVQDIIAIVHDAEKYPSPVRAVGSNHSISESYRNRFDPAERLLNQYFMELLK